jgi:hypothetical protein
MTLNLNYNLKKMNNQYDAILGLEAMLPTEIINFTVNYQLNTDELCQDYKLPKNDALTLDEYELAMIA